MKKTTISIVGTGNVAFHLAKAFLKSGSIIETIFGRNKSKVQEIAIACNANSSFDFLGIIKSDFAIICTSDDAIPEISNKLKTTNSIVLHTAGSVDFKELSLHNNYGVLYPLQSFSKNRSLNFENIPILIEANNSENLNSIRKLAETLSTKTIEVNSEERLKYHIAAVFVSNFVNHFYARANEFLKDEELDFSILYPLISEITKKIFNTDPITLQTGPAIRKDEKTLKKHISKLDEKPNFQKLYRFVSESIQEFHNIK